MKVKGLMTPMTPPVGRKKLDLERGFSLLELMVVIAMIMVIVATATPSLINVVSTARMRGSMSSMATFAQRVRGDAVRSNKTKSLWNTNSGGEYFLYSADAASTAPALSTADSMMPAGKQVVFIGTPTAASVPTILDPTMAFGSSTAAINSPQISFNTRGIPCAYPSSGTNCTTGQPFVWYFIFQPPFGSSRLACLSVSPAGRIKTWYWDGAQWTN